MMIARIVVNYLGDIKELDEPNHKKQYMLFAAGIVLANYFTYFGTFIQQKER